MGISLYPCRLGSPIRWCELQCPIKCAWALPVGLWNHLQPIRLTGRACPSDAESCRLPSDAALSPPGRAVGIACSLFNCWRGSPIRCRELQAPVRGSVGGNVEGLGTEKWTFS
ncbi:hypothetical protein PO909_013557 [Leuciscus waleckii]